LTLNEILFAPNADFFRCADCRSLWHVAKGQEGPPSHSLLGNSWLGKGNVSHQSQ